jgi:deoxyribodipyrimidine photo-lyase
MKDYPPAIVWFRQDLRLGDNPALSFAAQSGKPLILVYINDESSYGRWPPGEAAQWWLHNSLNSLNEKLLQKDSRLILRSGKSTDVLTSLARTSGADLIVWNRRYEPPQMMLEEELETVCKKNGIACKKFNGSLLHDPSSIKTGKGEPYKVFTPFYNRCIDGAAAPEYPLPAPENISSFSGNTGTPALEKPDLLPEQQWRIKFEKHWCPGEAGAWRKFENFLQNSIDHYKEGRDRPDKKLTSMLSPHLHFGEISPRQIFYATGDRSEAFIRELYWREFCYNLLYNFPDLPEKPLQEKFKNFPWKNNKDHLEAWQKGLTGYPLIDAGMRQLRETGWMHNRVRMVTGSFLIKDLLLHWREGEKWFWNCLVDADLANNSAGWQWIAGCGADAAPFFRIFNPGTQGKKFDPDGEYVRKFVPELKNMPACYIHNPRDAPEKALNDAEVRLGVNYPAPIVDHKQARAAALKAYEKIK